MFNFEFLEAEQMIVVKNKKTFFKTESENHFPPRLTLQLWDDDLISKDDYLSEFEFFVIPT